MRSRRTISILALLSLVAVAADAPAPLTDAERIAILHAQRDLLTATDQLKATPQFKAWEAANDAMNKAYAGVFTSRHVTDQEFAICDGPGTAPCEKVAKGDMVLVAKGKPAAAADAAKKEGK